MLRSEVFTVLTMMNAVFWDVTPYGPCKNRRFGGIYRLHQQGENNQQTRNNVSSNLELKHTAKPLPFSDS
jgi:hypothetical protein